MEHDRSATDRLEVEEPSYSRTNQMARFNRARHNAPTKEPASVRMTTIALFLVSTFGMYWLCGQVPHPCHATDDQYHRSGFATSA